MCESAHKRSQLSVQVQRDTHLTTGREGSTTGSRRSFCATCFSSSTHPPNFLHTPPAYLSICCPACQVTVRLCIGIGVVSCCALPLICAVRCCCVVLCDAVVLCCTTTTRHQMCCAMASLLSQSDAAFCHDGIRELLEGSTASGRGEGWGAQAGGGGERRWRQEGICHGAGPVSNVIGSVQCHYDAIWQRDLAHGSLTAKAASPFSAELVVAESTFGTFGICPDYPMLQSIPQM